MLCCMGLFGGYALGSILGGPWIFIGPVVGFGLGFVGDMKLMHSRKGHKSFGLSCCGSGHEHNENNEKFSKDPVCGMRVNEKKYNSELGGKSYYFCSNTCLSTFKKDPLEYIN